MAGGKGKSIAAAIFSVIAILGGLNAVFTGLMLGRRAGWEMMMIYALPPVIFAIVAIAIKRGVLSYIAVGAGLLAIVGLVLGM